MEVELSFAEALVFRRALNALRSVCRDIRVYVHRNSLHLEGLNDSRTAWMQVAFARCFFSSFRLLKKNHASRTAGVEKEAFERGAGATEDSAEERFEATVSGKQLWKAIAKAVSPSSGSASGRGTLTLDRMLIKGILSTHADATDSSALSLTFFFRGLPVTQTVLISAVNAPHTLPVFIRWKRRHLIAMPARSWMKLLDEYLLNPENVTLVHDVAGEALKVQSEWQPHAPNRRDLENSEEAKQTAAFQGLYGEIVLEKNHFDRLVFDSRLPAFSHLTFSSRELRATAALCEHFEAPLTVSYRLPGRPVVCCFGAAAPLAAASLQEEAPVSSSSSPSSSTSSSENSSPAFVPHQILREALRCVQEEYEAAKTVRRSSFDGVSGHPEGEASAREKAGEDGAACGARRQEGRGALRGKHRASRAWAGFVWISTSPLESAEGAASEDASVWGDDYLDYVELYRQLEEPVSAAAEEFFAPAPHPSPCAFASASSLAPRSGSHRAPRATDSQETRERSSQQKRDKESETVGGSQACGSRERARVDGGEESGRGDSRERGETASGEAPDSTCVSSAFVDNTEKRNPCLSRRTERRLKETGENEGSREDDEESVATWLGEDEEPEEMEAFLDSRESGETAERATNAAGETVDADEMRKEEKGAEIHRRNADSRKIHEEGNAENEKERETWRQASRARVRRWIEHQGLAGAAEMYRHLAGAFANVRLSSVSTPLSPRRRHARLPVPASEEDLCSSSEERGETRKTKGPEGEKESREDARMTSSTDDESVSSVSLSDVEMPGEWLVSEKDWEAGCT
uniref:Rad9 protein n=1 Tax=Toxoplasma gondii COUG TaxID=1074873 RepID=A0A2G8Y8B4_TOXGO|nr:Rad9 protein [Toxoplasma gondii COUG]